MIQKEYHLNLSCEYFQFECMVQASRSNSQMDTVKITFSKSSHLFDTVCEVANADIKFLLL